MLDERRKIEEIIAIYRLEPDLRGLIAEGWEDRKIFNWFLKKCGRDDITVYLIDVIDVPDELIEKYNLNTGSNRSRVIAVSFQVEEVFQKNKNILCIADKDYDVHLSVSWNHPTLIFTDYNCLESYLVCYELIDKFFSLVCTNFFLNPSEFLEKINSILKSLYIIRLTNEKLKWGMKWIQNLSRYFQIKGKEIIFEEERYINAYLNKNSRMGDKKVFLDVLENYRNLLCEDIRLCMRGHDFTEFFFLLHNTSKSKPKFNNHDAFVASLWGCIELSMIENEGLFKKLLKF
ncbi:MAG: hypothetical protein GY749_28535 [Desulfobacteraceae bacterium]|nr:hypothetical protein [Desulfobacteraceae bacterium]